MEETETITALRIISAYKLRWQDVKDISSDRVTEEAIDFAIEHDCNVYVLLHCVRILKELEENMEGNKT